MEQIAEVDFSYASLAAAYFFWLDPKETKHQGLDLSSDKFVKALISASQAAMKNRSGRDAWFGGL
ncbi:hypothetical protein [Pedobacter sandarakinus]|uniref:hypothetical protein n=1 Tax=Pedobacter sandarakinus TaxID=353156 RepID=UPI0022484DC0|nr:hypothetical protein [Pedobacter sandarakinus]MCX2574026.1 hypothetical protein [Pedobacter sandarakinus]